MSVLEIIGGVILIIAAAAIIFLTLCQHTKGQGLAGAINGAAGGMNGGRVTPADQMLSRLTKIAGVVFMVVAVVACILSSRVG